MSITFSEYPLKRYYVAILIFIEAASLNLSLSTLTDVKARVRYCPNH